MKRTLTILLSALLILGLAGCQAVVPDTESEAASSQSMPADTGNADIYLPKPPDKRLSVAAKQNKDAIAWLTIEGTTIDDAVFQSADNEYYLRRDAYGEYSLEGCYFADYECGMDNVAALGRNTVIYGHHFTGDEEMRFFAQLFKYTEDEEWAVSHRYIQLSVSDAMLTYEVISAGQVDANEDKLAISATLTLDELAQLAQDAIDRSVFDFGAEAATCGQLLTLSTCTGDYSTRLVVVARLVSM